MKRWAGATWRAIVWVSVAACGVPAAARAQDAAPPPPAESRAGLETYRIGAGDTLQVFVWKEAELTRDVVVRIDGKISLPLLGDVQAAGLTPGELAEELGRRLKKFVGSPVVTVGVNHPTSTRFFVLGMVAKSGEFPMSGPTTVVQALALAGGLREYAKADAILVLRQEGPAPRFIPVNYKRLESGRDGAQNILLQPGDTVLVP